jgi:hypothetical protein
MHGYSIHSFIPTACIIFEELVIFVCDDTDSCYVQVFDWFRSIDVSTTMIELFFIMSFSIAYIEFRLIC